MTNIKTSIHFAKSIERERMLFDKFNVIVFTIKTKNGEDFTLEIFDSGDTGIIETEEFVRDCRTEVQNAGE